MINRITETIIKSFMGIMHIIYIFNIINKIKSNDGLMNITQF